MSRRTAQVLLCATAATLALCGPASAATFDLVTSWGSPGGGDGQFMVLKDIAVSPSGDVYTVEDGGGASNRVQRFDANGAFLGKFGSEGSGTGQFVDPWGIAASAHQVFVVDAVQQPGDSAGPRRWCSRAPGAQPARAPGSS